MRTLIMAAFAVLTLGFISAAPASATGWSCQGGWVACGGDDAPRAYSKKSGKHAAAKSSRKYAKKSAKSYSYADAGEGYSKPRKAKKSYSSNSYSGGSSGGLASYYWQPQRVASGGWFNPNAMTAAHKTLPFGTKVRVTNNHNGRSVVVTINDRGPYIKGRVIDLSSAAAGVIGMKGAGVVPISMSVLGR